MKYVSTQADAQMVDVEGERYLRLHTPGTDLYSWFQPVSTGVFPDFSFKWMGSLSTDLEIDYRAQQAIERARDVS